MCRGFCARWRLTSWKYSGVGFVPEPHAGAIRCVADELDAGRFESGADEPDVCRCCFAETVFSFDPFNCAYAD